MSGSQSDPVIAVLESESSAGSAENGAKNGVAFIDIGFVDSLPNGVSGGASGLEGVFEIEGGAQLVDLEFGGGSPDFKAPGDRITRGTNMRRVHDPPNLDISG